MHMKASLSVLLFESHPRWCRGNFWPPNCRYYAKIDQVALATLIGPWRNTEDSNGFP